MNEKKEQNLFVMVTCDLSLSFEPTVMILLLLLAFFVGAAVCSLLLPLLQLEYYSQLHYCCCCWPHDIADATIVAVLDRTWV